MTKTIGLLLAVSPFALALVTGLVELPRKGGSLLPLLSLYGIAFVPGAALTLFLQLQVSRPLRRLAYVLAEAAEISSQLGRAPVQSAGAPAAPTAAAVPVTAPAPAVPSPAPVPPEVRDAWTPVDPGLASSAEQREAIEAVEADSAAAGPPTLSHAVR
ncbi:hypothetical protein ACU4HD_20835 [Cupriavidus basilensis]